MKYFIYITLFLVIFSGCKNFSGEASNSKTGKLKVVTTTTMITDIVKQIGGSKVEVQGLMGSGVDPHLYKASEGDVNKLFNADVVFYNGLHLEGKLEEIFEKMRKRGVETIALAETLPKETLIASENFASNYDPHIWFDIRNWRKCLTYATEELSRIDPENAREYSANSQAYETELSRLENIIKNKISTLSKDRRILVTAHDAFNYFGKAYDFQVVGLQGLSTATEAGVQDVQEIAKFIIENRVKAIFVESSVPRRTIEALQASVSSKGHEVTIGGTLYSDALGSPNTPEASYIGMFQANVNTIVDALQ